MKKFIRLELAWGACLLLSLAVAGPAGQTKIKTVDGVQVVMNSKKPDPPKGAATKLVLEEQFSIGTGETAEDQFAGVSGLDVDGSGNIFVLDIKENQVKVFNAAGKYLRKFGKKGQGPGELNLPVGIICTPENEVIVVDSLNQRLAIFAPEGKFLRSLSTAKALGLVGVLIDPKKNIIASVVSLSGQKMSREIKKFDSQLNPILTLGTFDFPNVLQGRINPFGMIVNYDLDGRGNVFLGSNQDYEIKVFDDEGKLIRKVIKAYDPVPITKEEIDKMMSKIPATPGINLKERLEFPKHYPAMKTFLLDEEGRLFVTTYEKGKKKGEQFYDVFDPQGRYIAKLQLAATLYLWKGNRVYTTEEDEEGYNIIKSFNFRWEK